MLDTSSGFILRWNGRNKQRYIDLGYEFTKICDEFVVTDESHLSKSSKAIVRVICDYCGNVVTKNYQTYVKQHDKKYGDACVKCQPLKNRDLCLDRFGVENIFQLEDTKQKSKETSLAKYGTERPCQSQEVKEIIKQSCLNKYGVTTTALVPEVMAKRDSTNLALYGAVNVFASRQIQQKIAQSYYIAGTCRTSKPQLALYKKLKELYGNCELNYPCDIYSLDCYVVVDGVKFDVEYDGTYWHRDKERDERRNNIVISNGYKVFRIVSDVGIPDDNTVIKSISKMIEENLNLYKIEVA